MKNFLNISLVVIFIVFCFIPFDYSRADDFTTKMKGKILLQVESRGEAWYVNPKDSKRYYMANGESAYNVMHNLGIGITNDNLAKLQNNKTSAKKQNGKIFLKVEDKGQAYYVNSDGILYYLKDGDAAYNIMRSLGLGITNNNLNKIALSDLSDQPQSNNFSSSSVVTTNTVNQSDYSLITIDDVAPYLTGVVEVVCKKRDYNNIEQLNSTGSGSLIKLSSDSYAVITNNHVISGNDQCFVLAPNSTWGVSGIYELDLDNIKNWNNIADEAVIPIIASSVNRLNTWDPFIFNADINQLNYNIWNLKSCVNDISKASPVMIIGYPAFSTITGADNVAGALKNQIIADGIISGYETSSINDGLPYSNYYISAKIDSGDSGGIALSKDKNGLCLLGIPTWITVTGNYANAGLVQNINNIIWANHTIVKTKTNEQICQDKYGSNSIWSGTTNSKGGAICDCISGYEFNSSGTECVEQNYDQRCQSQYGTFSIWSGKIDSSNKPTCSCQSGYSWSGNGETCASQTLLQEWCENKYGFASYSHPENGKAVCDCIYGYVFNYSRSSCVSYYYY